MGKKIETSNKTNKADQAKNASKGASKNTKNKTQEKNKNTSVQKKKEQIKNKKSTEKREKENLMEVESEVKEDEKIITDLEETTTLEDMKEKYQNCLKTVQEKLASNLDSNLVSKAVKCLKTIVMDKYKNSLNILQNENEEFLYLNFVLGKLPFKYSMRPVSVHLPHSLYGEKFNTSVCLFVKDSRVDFKDLNIHKNLPFKLKVIDINKLKLNYSRFQQRRNLLKDFELFLCDQKIYMLLKKLLGKPFYVSKKYPLPLKLDYSNPEEIKKNIIENVERNTIFTMTHGPNYSVKIARAVSENEHILKNVTEGVAQVLSHILKWGVDFEE